MARDLFELTRRELDTLGPWRCRLNDKRLAKLTELFVTAACLDNKHLDQLMALSAAVMTWQYAKGGSSVPDSSHPAAWALEQVGIIVPALEVIQGGSLFHARVK